VILSGRVEQGRTGGANPPGEPQIERVSLSGDAIDDFDPAPGDASESPESVGNVIDGNPSTVWSTETYQFQFGDPDQKLGVGLTIDAGEPVAAQRLDIVTSTPGWDAEVYAANDVPDSIEGWGEPIGAENDLGEEEAIGLDTGGKEYTHYLLWITSLPEGGRAEIAELTLRQ
jgi:serine/threonine-protein kinase